ncbi:methyltransferase domain-containing protein [Dokdonella sp.]|uniref:methyltransferase domain-containing protein n=1 Tax=Dokdonella sp. TaxID=2291710 RepID=UPI0025C728D5|nr:methyltransferase domain-containing protein [Dokdonella sp.]MBX3688941.1 methyltransferase domain-containing protein [Dokdonella sp.]
MQKIARVRTRSGYTLPQQPAAEALISAPDSLYALPEPTALLRSELALVPLLAAARPAGHALLLQACATHQDWSVDTRHLRLSRLHVDGDGLRGDLSCRADALPFEDAAFQLVVVQHAADALPAAPDHLAELARVLAPGGTLQWFGFNRWSPWLVWLHWRARGGLEAPTTSGADALRRRLSALGLSVGRARMFGSCWPSLTDADGVIKPLRAAWALTACKQQSVLTPLRPQRKRVRIAARPSLAVPSRRNAG